MPDDPNYSNGLSAVWELRVVVRPVRRSRHQLSSIKKQRGQIENKGDRFILFSGWEAAIAGGRIGLAVSAAIGIETDPGAIVSSAIGEIIFDTAGYLGATWLTDYVQD